MTPTAIFLVYVLPALLAVVGCFLAWRGEDTESKRSLLEVSGIGLALLMGFCALEARWPWEMHSPWRRHYWIPAGIVALTILHGLRVTKWVQLALATLGLWMLLHKYALQLHTEWTDQQHLALLGGMLVFAFISFFGHWKLAETVPGNLLLIHFGALVSGAALYAFAGTSSAKVAQWMTIIGSIFAGVFILTLWQKRRHLKPTGVLLASWLLIGGLYYGFYSGEQSLLAPLLVLMCSPCIGLFSGKISSHRAGWAIFGWTALCLALATAAYFLTRSPIEEEEEDYLDAYGFVTPQFDAVDR